MKILVLTPDVTADGFKVSYNTGFSLMVNQIAKSFAAGGNDAYLYSSSLVCNETKTGGYVLLGRTIMDIVLNSRLRDWIRATRYLLRGNLSLGLRKRLFKYIVSTGYVEKLIDRVSPDIVHINSVTPAIFPFLIACVRSGKPFAVTLHGLFSFITPNEETLIEQTVLYKLLGAGNYVTCVSSGVRDRLLRFYGYGHDRNMPVVLNSFTPGRANDNADVTGNCILSVGNICDRKNQIQVLRAYAMLPADIRKKHKLCIIGKDGLGGRLQEMAAGLGVDADCIFTGSLPHDEVCSWISCASMVVMASLDEGFGLPVIEGYSLGIPAVCFSDIDAFADLYSPDAMIPVRSRTDEALSDSILEALKFKWDKSRIVKVSEKYSAERMTDAYVNVFNQAIVEKTDNSKLTGWIDDYVMSSRKFEDWKIR